MVRLYILLLSTGIFILTPALSNRTSDIEVGEELAVSALSAAENLYEALLSDNNNDNRPPWDAFRYAITGHQNLLAAGEISNSRYLTVIDFSRPSVEERLWVIDLRTETVSYSTWVAHGRATGTKTAKRFSNVPQSNTSSLGFYVTGETYTGKHGYSLRLDGVDGAFNSEVRDRAIVFHGAPYVSEDFIRQNGSLGRSRGCPAVSYDLSTPIINLIREGSCLFVYYPDPAYLNHTEWLSSALAG